MTTKKPKSPILPSNNKDPTGVDTLERKAMKDFSRRINRVNKAYQNALNRIPSSPAVNARYEFQLNPAILSQILNDASYLVDQILLEGGEYDLWFYYYVEQASRRGTAQSFANLSQQSAAYAAERESLAAILISEPYQRRMALVNAREFEEMKGLTAQIKADMARVLTDGIGRGLNPREVSRNLTTQAGIEKGRANRIARTEITTALRRARWDEADESTALLGLNVRLLHFSALSPTTRQSHALRHAHVYTVDEVREWYATGANAINCKCSQVEVLVDEAGNPLYPNVIEMAKKEFNRQWAKIKVNHSVCHCCKKAA
ncbi:phage minor head protein [Kluyvera intermedia]|uniref:phage minor head protein n=1 Tax=Kluyvera intermedia TaxID=61648 RepID=UPI00372D15AC